MKTRCNPHTVAALAASFVLSATAVFAVGTGSIRGRVVDADGKPVKDAAVVIQLKGKAETGGPTQWKIKSDKNGYFIQVGLDAAPYAVTVVKEDVGAEVLQANVTYGTTSDLGSFTLSLDKLKSLGSAKDAKSAEEAQKAAQKLQADFAKAVQLTRDGKLDEAEIIYKELLVKSPNVPEIHYNLGVLYGQKKDSASAEAAYRKALEVQPEYADAAVALSGMLAVGGQIDEGIAVLKQGMERSPEDAALQVQMGWLLFNVGRSADAEAYFKKAAELGSSDPEVDFYLGSIAVGNNQMADAVARLEKYIAAQPRNAQNLATAQALVAALKPKK